MTEAQDAKNPEPIELGHGKVELEVFLEPTCPFSKRAFEKLQPLLDVVGEDKLTIKIRFVSQPWHLFSGIVTRSILAATATPGGKQAGLAAMQRGFRPPGGVRVRRSLLRPEHGPHAGRDHRAHLRA